MPSLSNQLATLTEAVKNARAWMREKFKQVDTDHDDQIELKKDVEQLNKRLDAFDKMKSALIIGIVLAVVGGLFGMIPAVLSWMAKGAPEP